MAYSEGTVGLPGPVADGVLAQIRFDKTRAQVTADAHGRYAEAARRGTLFIASNTAAQVTTVALAATYTGLCISNPLGNTKNAELLGVGFAISVAQAAIATLHLIGGYSATANVTHTAALAAPGIQNCLLGTGPASTMKADTSATITNPGYVLPLLGGFTAGAFGASPVVWLDLAGLIVLPPGAWAALGSLTSVTGFAGFAWEEV